MTGSMFGRGILAGFIASLALAILMLLKSAMGLMPEFNVIAMLAGMAQDYLGLPASPVLGWLGHFAIGAVLWGGLFAWLHQRTPGDPLWLRGTLFGLAAWVLMMVLFMPLAGAGFFAASLGFGVVLLTLILHLIFGAVMGYAYQYEGRFIPTGEGDDYRGFGGGHEAPSR